MISWSAWKTSDASVTKNFYRALERRGPIGMLARALFAANKASFRAKRYRGGNGSKSFRNLAFERKRASLYELSQILTRHGRELGILWGWGEDQSAAHENKWVLFVDIPQGQVSFHSPVRHPGPSFPRAWDGKHVSTERILGFTEQVLAMDIENQGILVMDFELEKSGGETWPMKIAGNVQPL